MITTTTTTTLTCDRCGKVRQYVHDPASHRRASEWEDAWVYGWSACVTPMNNVWRETRPDQTICVECLTPSEHDALANYIAPVEDDVPF